jgi:hypothetical protein
LVARLLEQIDASRRRRNQREVNHLSDEHDIIAALGGWRVSWRRLHARGAR